MTYLIRNTAIVVTVSVLLSNTVVSANKLVFAGEAKPPGLTATQIIDIKMDNLHDAADQGDKVRYLNHFANDAVFMGTDDWERWPYAEFSKYVELRFKDGKGWSYKPIKRYTTFDSSEQFAWVDEIVESEKWGRFRGTAVLEKSDLEWKIKHYSLTMLVPNESWEGVSDITKTAFGARTVDAGEAPIAPE